MKIIGIYKITSPSGRVYIGQSTDIELRFRQYSNILSSKGQRRLHYSFKKYGINSHKFEILEKCSIEELSARERFWQEYFDCLNKGLNCRVVKSEDKTGYISDETKDKIRKFRTGKKASLKTKKKISKSHIGLKHTKETRDKMSKFHKSYVARKVIDTKTGIVYKSITEASKVFKVTSKTLSAYLLGTLKNKTTLIYYTE